jgi:Protein of unknown function C-terminus (DUF2399)
MNSEPAPGGDSPAAGVLARLRASLGPETPLTGLPDGLVARSVQKVRADATSWRQVRDRRQRQRLETVVLMTTHVPPDDIATHLQSALGHSLGTCNFILGAQRRSWQAIRDRFGADALSAAFGLVRCGAIYLRCTVTEELSLGTPTGWYMTEAAMAGGARRAEAATAARADLDRRRQAVLGRLMDLLAMPTASSPAGGTNAEVSREAIEALAAALESTDGAARLPVLIAAAEDLLAGIRHGSPRAFSIAHFAHSKERDDAAALLADAGVPEEVAAALGIRRSPRIGVAGAIDAVVGGQKIPLSLLDGPALIRADQTGLTLVASAQRLIIVENLQAAESLAEQPALQPLAIVYTAGQPSAAARRHITALCNEVAATLLCPDADLGGVRIASAILNELPASAAETVTISDAGAWPHKPQSPWPADGATAAGLTRALDGPAAQLAWACLNRGYRVEQEERICEAVRHWLSGATVMPGSNM